MSVARQPNAAAPALCDDDDDGSEQLRKLKIGCWLHTAENSSDLYYNILL